MKKYSKKYWVFRWLFLAGYIAAAGVLIFEACLPRDESAKKSHAVGEVVSDIVNDFNGDQAKEILPTKATIQNSKFDYKVGQEVALDVVTEPSDTTYKSYQYSSNNEQVASVDETGLVSFLEEGSATITAKNTVVPTIFDTITFNVSNVEVESMTSKINAKQEDGVYKLEIYEDYIVTNVIKPSNATFKNVDYDYLTNDFFYIEDDTIHVTGDSNEAVFDINVTCGTITNTLKVKTFAPPPPVEDYPIEGLKASNVTKYVDQTSAFSLTNVSYIPSYTSKQYKGYTLESSDESIVKVQSNKTQLKITGTVGSATITVTSTYDESIKTTFTVTVKARGTLASISLGKHSSVMYVGATQTVTVNVNPSSAKVTKTFTSSNNDVLTATNAGKLTAVAVGNATVTVNVKDTINNINKTTSFDVEVKGAPPPNCASDFVIDYKVNEDPLIYLNEKINLDDYFGIASFIGNENPLDNSVFDFNFDISDEEATYLDHKLTPLKVGEINGFINFTNEDSSVISKEIKLTVVDKYKVCKRDETELTDTNIELSMYSTTVLVIKDGNKTKQSYKITCSNNTVIYTYANRSITITANEVGTGILKITPVIKLDDTNEKEKEITEYSKEVTFKVLDIETTRLDVYFYKGDEIVPTTDSAISMYMNETLDVKYALDEKTTKSKVTMKLSNNVATIRNGVIKPSKVGDTKLTVTESITGLVKEFDISIRHKVSLKDTGPFLLSGSATYDASSNTVIITNGDSAKISVNFTTESTYKKATYVVANTDICTIGTDGTITPKTMGQTKATITVKDSISTYIEFEINLKVERRPFIQDVNDFFLKVRKGVGHFGAFAVFGFLGTMTWFLFFRKKLFPIGVGANFAIGFGLSYLTELIQRYVPGRCFVWSDVWLDFEGFSIMAGFTTLVIVGIWLTKLLISKKKAKKLLTTPVSNDVSDKEETPTEQVNIEQTKEETGEK